MLDCFNSTQKPLVPPIIDKDTKLDFPELRTAMP